MLRALWVLSSCTGSQEPKQKTQQCSTAKQRFVKKGVQWLFLRCTGTPGHNRITKGRAFVDSLIDNDEKIASSKTNLIQFTSTVQKSSPI